MKSTRLNPLMATAAALALLLWFSAGIPQTFAAQNLVYINANINIPGQNAVIALSNDGAGNLSPVAGSPFATGGTGVAGTSGLLNDIQWDSDGELAINAAGTLLFAVNGHSNDFSGFNLNADGSLTIIPGSPFSSHGTQPASIGYKDNAAGNGVATMVIANKDSDPFQTQTAPNLTTFRVDSTGVPVWNSRSTFPLPAGSSPWQLLLPRNTYYFFGILFTGDAVSTYKLSRKGSIANPSSLVTSGDNGGGTLNPRTAALYVTMPAPRLLNVMSYDTAYNVSLVNTLNSAGKAPCWATTNKAATRLYIAETPSGTVTVYDISDALNPVQLQHLKLAVAGGGAGAGAQPYPTHTRLDPTESFLYVLDRRGLLHVLDVAGDGTLAENHTPFDLGLPNGAVPPLGLAVLSK
ncbi:MAG: beta-propeller fold lactonase family protein [Chthoniobacterales bacterium]